MSEHRPLSAVIIACNESARIRDCLASVSFADEILLVDSGSEDDTREIALSMGARVVDQDWLGYGPQKQFAVEQAGYDWVYCLDADERVTEELQKSILEVLEDASEAVSAYEHPRRNHFLGQPLFHGEGYPDMSLRLFDRRHARWSTDSVHEKVDADGEVGRLSGDLLHLSEDGIADYLRKQDHYTTLQAQILFERGKKIGGSKLVFSPLLRFIKFYVLRQGFRDGVPGLIHILIGCFNSFTKYAKLVELQKKSGSSG